MEKSTEDWLEVFELRVECIRIIKSSKKVKCCKSVIETAWREVLRILTDEVSWEEIKAVLARYLDESEVKGEAWKKLKHYKAGDKNLWEIESNVICWAKLAGGEENV